MKYFYENDNNEQIGPIDIDKLKSINIKGSTLIWKEGMDEWSEAKNFAELKDFFITPPPLPSKNDKSENDNVAKNKQNQKYSIWSYKGRMRRSNYFGYLLLLGILTRGITYLIENSYENDPILFIALLLIPILYLYIVLAIKRLHDMSFNSWLFFISFIPIINLILVFWDGIEGPNRYGPDPKGRKSRIKKK